MWAQFLARFEQKAVRVIVYSFIPDHVHLVVEGMSAESDLKTFVKLAKQYSGYYYARSHRGGELWQHGGHDRIIRDSVELLDRVRYVPNNR